MTGGLSHPKCVGVGLVKCVNIITPICDEQSSRPTADVKRQRTRVQLGVPWSKLISVSVLAVLESLALTIVANLALNISIDAEWRNVLSSPVAVRGASKPP